MVLTRILYNVLNALKFWTQNKPLAKSQISCKEIRGLGHLYPSFSSILQDKSFIITRNVSNYIWLKENICYHLGDVGFMILL